MPIVAPGGVKPLNVSLLNGATIINMSQLDHPKTKNSRRIRRVYLIALAILALIAAFLLRKGISHPLLADIPAQLSGKVTYEIVNRYPHDPLAYTEGLIIQDGFLYESTGLYGQSSLRKVELKTGQVLQQQSLEQRYFGEGLTQFRGKLYQLTWKEHTGFIYSLDDFSPLGTFSFPTEGWGLTTDGNYLILSDGSSQITYLDPETFEAVKSISVTLDAQPVENLNELEYIDRFIFANVYLTDHIMCIDPQTGVVVSVIDLNGLQPAQNAALPGEVLNGIAYDPQSGQLFVTGKNWPYLYEIRLKQTGTESSQAK